MSPTREQVVVAAAHRFPSEDRATILAVLDQYGIETHERERERVQMAILRLSEGSVDHLLSYTQHAKMDYRDVLWWAEYPVPDGPRHGPPEDTAALLEWITSPAPRWPKLS